MTTLVIVDSHQSAIGLSAHARAKITGDRVLSASEFVSPYKLLMAICKHNPAIVFFAWRGALLDILNDSAKCQRMISKLDKTSIGILIPDLQGLEASGVESDSKLLEFVDFYLVTSSELRTLYSQSFPTKLPHGLYRDMPDIAGINEVRKHENINREKRIIWVGNSKWGIRQGAIDHKGLHSLVTPLVHLLKEELPFKVIDSSTGLLPHSVVLDEIQKSSVLIQTSKAEGTGLPLLEAAGLGTVVITTNVGIASDFLTDELSKLIVEPNVNSFVLGIKYALDNFNILSTLLEARFASYISEIQSDSINFSGVPKTKFAEKYPTPNSLLVRLKWIRRWLTAKK